MSDIQGPFSSLIEDYTSVSTTTVIPAGQHRWYSNIPGAPTGAYTLLIGDGTSDLTELPRNLYNNSMAALENPVYGEPLEAGELFLDGTDSFISSDGREPVVDVVDFEPAKINVDGSEVDNPVVKWPGYRGANGFFGEYENELAGTAFTDTNCARTQTGDWLYVESAVAGTSYTWMPLTSSSNARYMSCIVEAGVNSDSAAIIVSDTAGSNPFARVNFTGQSFTFANGSVNAGCYFISPTIARVQITLAGLSTYDQFRLSANNGTGAAIGDSASFKDWMCVDAVDYPVPYTPGVHPASKLQYDFDWASNGTHTLEQWFYANEQGASQYVFDTRGASGDDSIGLYYNGTNWLLVSDDGTSSTTTLTGITDEAYNHINIVFISATSINVYVNGGVAQPKTTNVPAVASMSKILTFGSDYSFANQLLGYMQDGRLYAGSDVTTTHYTSGFPYYNPEKTYGQDGSWSIDKRGNVSGLFQQAGNIVESYLLDAQYVTKFDSGMMINHGVGAVPGSYVEDFDTVSEVAGASDYISIGTYK